MVRSAWPSSFILCALLRVPFLNEQKVFVHLTEEGNPEQGREDEGWKGGPDNDAFNSKVNRDE
jgi:hypothetical protein